MRSAKWKYTDIIQKVILEQGFDSFGIAKASFLEEEAPKLERWLKKGYHGKMKYMENHFEKRLDPRKLMPGTKSILVLTHNYFPKKDLAKRNHYAIAKYAYGKDYHKVLKKKLKTIIDNLKEKIGDIQARVFVDSAPIMERAWAKRAGIGWIGKNSLLLQKQKGSFLLSLYYPYGYRTCSIRNFSARLLWHLQQMYRSMPH